MNETLGLVHVSRTESLEDSTFEVAHSIILMTQDTRLLSSQEVSMLRSPSHYVL